MGREDFTFAESFMPQFNQRMAEARQRGAQIEISGAAAMASRRPGVVYDPRFPILDKDIDILFKAVSGILAREKKLDSGTPESKVVTELKAQVAGLQTELAETKERLEKLEKKLKDKTETQAPSSAGSSLMPSTRPAFGLDAPRIGFGRPTFGRPSFGLGLSDRLSASREIIDVPSTSETVQKDDKHENDLGIDFEELDSAADPQSRLIDAATKSGILLRVPGNLIEAKLKLTNQAKFALSEEQNLGQKEVACVPQYTPSLGTPGRNFIPGTYIGERIYHAPDIQEAIKSSDGNYYGGKFSAGISRGSDRYTVTLFGEDSLQGHLFAVGYEGAGGESQLVFIMPFKERGKIVGQTDIKIPSELKNLYLPKNAWPADCLGSEVITDLLITTALADRHFSKTRACWIRFLQNFAKELPAPLRINLKNILS